MKKLLLIPLLVFLFSCASKKMDTWMGHTKQDIIERWGYPDRIVDNEQSGEILIYAKNVYVAPSTYNTGYSAAYIQGENYWSYTYFFINPNGVAYHWLKQKQPIPPQQIDVRIIRGY
jgi:hypothetical protein